MRGAVNLRFVQIMGDLMEPTLRRHDYVLVAPASRYTGEGIYMINKGDDAAPYSVDAAGTKDKPFRLIAHNKHYPVRTISIADFERCVSGKVAMTCNVKDPDLLRNQALAA